MVSSDAATVDQYLAELPDDRRAAISAVRNVILANLPDGYEETMRWGMISYEIPLARYPDTYNGQPLSYAALVSQKRHMAVYLNGIYADGDEANWFTDPYGRRVRRALRGVAHASLAGAALRRRLLAGHAPERREVGLVGRTPDARDRIDVRRLGPQRRGGAPLLRPGRERVELVVAHRVLVGELVHRRLVEVGEQHLAPLGRVGP